MRRAIGLAAVAGALFLAGGAGSASGPSFVLGPCPVEFDTAHTVDCGTLRVPENRTNPNSRLITVAAAIVHATAKHPKADPIIYQNGGPSFPTLVPWAMEVFDGTTFPDDRDVILMDLRGEGSSVPRLSCPELNDADRQDFYAKPYIGANPVPRYSAAIRACYDRWTASGADLSGYNSAENVADMEALRKALGIKQWNIWFISADGLAGMTYLRLFPSSIRAAILDSPQSNTM
jgi:pimeloyl-ACP methyl ester carboxylesterase